MIPAKDIMTKNVISIKPSTSIIEAIDLLLENKISGLPVVNDEKKLVGIVSEKDFLHILFIDDIDVKESIARFMSKKVASFSEDDDIYDICDYFLKSNNRRVPIVDKEGRLVGVVSRRNILEHILIAVLQLNDKEKRPSS